MSVAASQAPSSGTEALLAATSNAPASKTPGAAATPPGQTAPEPDLFSQMVANEVEQQAAAGRGAALDSTATAASTAGASKKVAGAKSRLATAAGAAAAAPEPGQHSAAADAAPVPTPYVWLPQSSQLAFAAAASGGSFSATDETGGDGAAGQSSTGSARTDAEVATTATTAASLPAATPNSTAGLGQAFADSSLLGTRGEGPSKLATKAAAASAIEPAGLTQETGPAAAAAAPDATGSAVTGDAPRAPVNAVSISQTPASVWPASTAAQAERPAVIPAPPAFAAAAPDATGNAVTGDAPRAPVKAVSVSQTSAPVWPATTAAPDETTPGTGPKAASLTRNRVELRATELPATETAMAQAAGGAAGAVMDTAASLFARLVARSGGQTSDPEGLASAPQETGVAGSTGRVGGDGLAEGSTLAFQALLVPAPETDRQFAGQVTWDAGDAPAGSASAGGNSTLGSSAGPGGSRSSSLAPRDPNPGLALAAQAGQTGGTAQALAPAASNPDVGAAASQSANRSHGAAAASASPETASAAELASAPKPAAGGAAREIHLELRDADARVNVRLVERAGAVQVDVRTPDSHLAAALRDDLPALAARLEQTGLRTESWHDAPAAAAVRMRTAEATATASAESSQNQSRREGGKNNPHDDQPREKRQQQPSTESKEFTWLYTSLT